MANGFPIWPVTYEILSVDVDQHIQKKKSFVNIEYVFLLNTRAKLKQYAAHSHFTYC